MTKAFDKAFNIAKNDMINMYTLMLLILFILLTAFGCLAYFLLKVLGGI